MLERAAKAQGIRVTFLVASLPDPIDSFTGWQFDPMLDAMTQAIAASDYVLDRFHFPDLAPEGPSSIGAARGTGRAHEVEPGVIVFRNQAGAGGGGARRLVLFVVHENPASGVHVAAMANAVRLVIPWVAGSDDNTIRILGPTFSGASDSIRRVLTDAKTALVASGAQVRVISGSATDPNVGGIITSALPGKVTFQATVHDNNLLVAKLVDEIDRVGWRDPIAIMFEANTQYGRQIQEQLVKQGRGKRLIQLPFPLNISRLRTTAPAGTAATPTLGLPSKLRPLALEEPKGSPEDQIPQFNPTTTATYVELALASTLDTVRRERVRTVALMATDPRDKLYLAQQIARYSPDVSIVTAESDSLYIHPDYSAYLQGAMVASTYPLYSPNQQWSYGYQGSSERRQFANGSAQGIYNAALALLDYDSHGRPLAGDATPRLLEYGTPGQRCDAACGPPVWISVVGRGGEWPVRASSHDFSPGLFLVAGTATNAEPPHILASPMFAAFLILMTFAILAYTFRVVSSRPGLMRADSQAGGGGGTTRRLWRAATQPEGGRLRSYLLVALFGAMLIESFVTVLCFMRLRIETGREAQAAFVAAAAGLVALWYLAGRILIASARFDSRRLAQQTSFRELQTWAVLLFTGACVWNLWALGGYLLTNIRLDVPDKIGFVARALDFGSGVSPTLPVLFLGAALTAWGVTELTRVRSASVALADATVQPLLQETTLADVGQWVPAWRLMNRSILAVPSGLWTVGVLVLVGTCVFAFDPIVAPLVTIEGTRFGVFVSSVLLLVQVMLTLTILQFVFLWSRLRRLLDTMEWHRMSPAYERIPRDLFPTHLFPRLPRVLELQAPVAYWDSMVAAGGIPDIPADCLDIDAQLGNEVRTSPRLPWSNSATWTKLLHAATSTATSLRRHAVAVPAMGGSAVVSAGIEGAAVMQAVPAVALRIEQSENLIAMLMAFVIRDALARLGQNLLFVIGGVVLVFCSHTLFPFQQHTQLQVLGWTYTAVTFAAILVVLTQIKRNEIISRFTSTKAGERTTWDSAFVLRLTVFALLPLLTLFAAQFPDLGGWLLQWMGPVQRALP